MSKPELKELELTNKIVGFFDIDDTLTKGNTTIYFAKFLSDRNTLKQSYWDLIQKDLTDYKNSSKNAEAYRKFAVDVLDHFAQGLKGKNVDIVLKEARIFFQESLLNNVKGYAIRTFSKELVNKVRSKGFSVAVSGSPLEVLIPLSEYLGFDVLETTWFEKVDGKYTGEVTRNLALDEEKAKVILNYQINNSFSRSKSFAFGDSLHDLPLLKSVDNSFVIGENPLLLDLAKQNGWNISIDGDNILEEVERRLIK